MAKDTQRRFLGRDQQAHERGNGGFHLFQRKETTGQTDQDRVSEDSGIKTSGLESMAEPRLEDDAETSKSTVHEAGGLERMMGRPVLQRESALIWMEDVAGYLLALAEIIQERQKERTVIHEATER